MPAASGTSTKLSFFLLRIIFRDEVRTGDLFKVQLDVLDLAKGAIDHIGGVKIEDDEVVAATERAVIDDAIEYVGFKNFRDDLSRYVLRCIVAGRNRSGERVIDCPPNSIVPFFSRHRCSPDASRLLG